MGRSAGLMFHPTAVNHGAGGAVVGNIFEHGFEDGTFGSPPVNGGFSDGPLVGGDFASPSTRGWSIQTGAGYRGTKFARWDSASATGGSPYMCYPFISSNVANPQPSLYHAFFRVAFRPLTEPADFHKIFLFREAGFGTQLGTFDFDSGDDYKFFWNNYGDSFTAITGLPSKSSLVAAGVFRCLEFDYLAPTSGKAHLKCYLDDSLIYEADSPANASTGHSGIGVVEIGGTLNSGAASFDVDCVGISTAKMGLPA